MQPERGSGDSLAQHQNRHWWARLVLTLGQGCGVRGDGGLQGALDWAPRACTNLPGPPPLMWRCGALSSSDPSFLVAEVGTATPEARRPMKAVLATQNDGAILLRLFLGLVADTPGATGVCQTLRDLEAPLLGPALAVPLPAAPSPAPLLTPTHSSKPT